MRFLRFQKWLSELLADDFIESVYYEEVRRHLSTDSAHIHGGLLAVMQAECEARKIPYMGIPVGTIKKHATGKGNAGKQEMVESAKLAFPNQQIKDDNQADALWILSTSKTL